ncbi:MAG: DNA-directed RNA polymerase subunit omega [Candidatus Aminicenantes bacterium]|nr:DNA-directed RNA polymerase subunit omega [Candidatus Aminicenantes bacterium]
MRNYGDVDSKFRFVILAAMRAKQLLKGAKPKVKTRSRNPIRIAQLELQAGLIDYNIVTDLKEEVPEVEEQVFLGDDLGGDGDVADAAGGLDEDEDKEEDKEGESDKGEKDEEGAEDDKDESDEVVAGKEKEEEV